ncbi:MAG: regulatory protein RecX [Micrococcales bacterium]|nr:regulatory protein RecX [Micrococcales bacterium]
MGPRSRAQLQEKLRVRGCPDEAAVVVLDRFTELGLIDDRAYAQMLVSSRRQTKGLARRALAHELRRKGIADEHARDALADVDTADEEEQAHDLVAKKLRTMHGLEAAVQTRRLAGMLARKGYSSTMSYRVIRQELDQSPAHRRD